MQGVLSALLRGNVEALSRSCFVQLQTPWRRCFTSFNGAVGTGSCCRRTLSINQVAWGQTRRTVSRYLTNNLSEKFFYNPSYRSTIFGNFGWRVHVLRFGSTVTRSPSLRKRHRTVVTYVCALAVLTAGMSYAAVPLYRMYCQATGLGGTVKLVDLGDQIETMTRKPERVLTIKFNADTSNALQWRFKPQQSEVKLVPGETALAFYKAKNLTDKAITGISTYNVVPFEAGQYFNKIQCFCFEEQRLNPNEEVDMPVFFYIDPEITEDPNLAKVDTITLSYTFFEAKEGNAIAIEGQRLRGGGHAQ